MHFYKLCIFFLQTITKKNFVFFSHFISMYLVLLTFFLSHSFPSYRCSFVLFARRILLARFSMYNVNQRQSAYTNFLFSHSFSSFLFSEMLFKRLQQTNFYFTLTSASFSSYFFVFVVCWHVWLTYIYLHFIRPFIPFLFYFIFSALHEQIFCSLSSAGVDKSTIENN